MDTMEILLSAKSGINPDEFELSFATRFNNPIRYYDDSIGPLWILRDSMGVVGVVRAQNESCAYKICEDEFLPVVALDELHDAYGLTRAEFMDVSENQTAIDYCDLSDGYSLQSNSTGSGIVAHDLNGESLELLTVKTMRDLEIKVKLTA